MDRRRRTRTLLATALALALTAPAARAAAPEILKTSFPGPVAGSPLDVTVTARNAAGMVVGFGSGQDGFGLSACTVGPRGEVASPSTSTLSAPHTFTTPGTGTAGLQVLAGGCATRAPATAQRVAYTVVAAGQAPVPSTVSAPSLLPLDVTLPALPGLPLSVPEVQVPGVLGGAADDAALSAACPGTGRRFRNSAAGRAAVAGALLCLNNAERARRGLAPLSPDGRLARAALSHSRAMYRKRFFAHVGPGSLTLQQRVRRTRYVPRRGRWLIGENIAFGRGRASSPLAIHRAWMRSTGHRANILNRRFRQVGFGVTRQAPYGRGATYTADFGTRG